jgi:hypothetical protein
LLLHSDDTAGTGVTVVHSRDVLESYDFPFGPVAFEELLELDRDSEGMVISPAVHYMSGNVIGKELVDQIMEGFVWR